MVFLPGDHVLDMNITIANVARLTMSGEPSRGIMATVVRNGPVGFSFTNMVNFNIYSLAFTSYNYRSLSYGSHPPSNSALFLQSTRNAKVFNCSFHDNLGTALSVENTSVILLGNSKFVMNQCACQSVSESEAHDLGCGITALDSTLTFTGSTYFFQNNQKGSYPFRPSYCAGAIWASTSLVHFNGTNNFIDNANSVFSSNPAIYANTHSSLSFSGTSNFKSNSAGVIYAVGNVKLTFSGINNFFNNSAQLSGGVISMVSNVILTFSGTNHFYNNSAKNGGVISARGTDCALSFIGTSQFSHNLAHSDGGVISSEGTNGRLSFSGTNIFNNNSAKNGGVISLEGTKGTNTKLSFSGISNFSHNSASKYGGVIYTKYNVLNFQGINNFSDNSANNGGAISGELHSLLSFVNTVNFIHNSAKHYGGAIHGRTGTSISFNGTSDFSHNSACNGGAINTFNNIVLDFTGNISFCSNFAMQGGAISANRNSTLKFDGSISFTHNGNGSICCRHNTNELDIIGGSHGGAIRLFFTSTFSILPHTTVYWENDYARFGGAIYVYSANPLVYCTKTTRFVPRADCFFQLPGQNLSSGLDVQLVFKNNSADTAGSVLYGGAIDNCTLIGLESYNSGEVFHMLSQYERDNTTSSVSSDPSRVCVCESDHPNCSNPKVKLSVHPGETFQVSVVSTGQGTETVQALVRSCMDSGWLLNSQYIQQTNRTCTTLNYTVFSLQHVSRVELYADGLCSTFGDTLVLKLNINQTCPHGFSISQKEHSCICDQKLQNYTNNCNITNGLGQITREPDDTFWVGYDPSHGLTVHPHCPFDYCVNSRVVFPLNNTDIQCANNRSGLLCGACKNEQCNDSLACNSTRYSLVLGSSHCKQCSNLYLSLLIAFAGMGVALVFLLFICKLTVATGTISGLVFYANIVGANHTLFQFPDLSVFIAWLNLDFGIETCFYDGMDAYGKTWLQFVFPVYIWVLVGLIIVVSHFSQKFAKRLGNNPVSVLATLILLSYAKILRTLIATVSFTYLNVSSNARVWLYDANIDYLGNKHIPLFLVAMFVFTFLFLPYTLLLLFGQWLQAISHLRLFSWVNSARLKPFMDSYHAPYKPRHRYWPGLLLVIRCVLLLVFAVNYQCDPSINLLAILVGTGILQLWAWVSGGVYKNWCLDALEGSFTLNLIILSVATYHIKLSGGDQLAVGYTSVSIALATFIGILSYHIFQHTSLRKKVPKLNLKLKTLNNKRNAKQLDNSNDDLTESGAFDQLREPLLDDLPQPTHSVV